MKSLHINADSMFRRRQASSRQRMAPSGVAKSISNRGRARSLARTSRGSVSSDMGDVIFSCSIQNKLLSGHNPFLKIMAWLNGSLEEAIGRRKADDVPARVPHFPDKRDLFPFGFR